MEQKPNADLLKAAIRTAERQAAPYYSKGYFDWETEDAADEIRILARIKIK